MMHGRWRIAAVAAALLGACTATPTDRAPQTAAPPSTTSPTPSPTTLTDDVVADDSDGPAPSDLAAGRSLIATAIVDAVPVRAAPDLDETPVHVLDHPTDRGAPRTFLVEQRQGDWFEVLLPVRPNGSRGWIRAEDVELSQTAYAVEADLADFELRVLRDGEEVLTTPIAYGDEDTPTPGGRFFITELLKPPDPDGVYGTYAFGLSGFSDVLLSFAGGEGVIGIHGTNDPDSIGGRVSAGCIRVPDDVIVELAGMLPLGTPVAITG